jgi:hypothetical protein
MIALQVASVVLFVALVAVILRLQRSKTFTGDHGKLAQPHHGYAVLLGLIPSLWAQVPALLLGFDDVYQHWRQAREPFYRSPVHRLAHKVGII